MKKQLTYIHDYKNNDKYRKSFNNLARNTFGIEFEAWYRSGGWTDGYCCFSFADGDEVVVNLSVSTMDFHVDGEKYTAAQVGTVMTRPDYRGLGYNSQLMREAIERYADCDLMFLFADEEAVPYYEKYGFKAHKRHDYALVGPFKAGSKTEGVKKLCMNCATDRAFVRRRSVEANALGRFDVKGAEDILMWYATYFHQQDFLYIPDLDTVVAGHYRDDSNVYELLAVYAANPYDLDELLPYILHRDTSKINFQFTPADDRPYIRSEAKEPIYVRSEATFDKFEKFPELSKA